MKISDLSTVATPVEPVIWGIEVDEGCFTPPKGLQVAGLMWSGSAETEISDDLIDTIIAFNLSGLETILELRPTDVVDPDYILKSAGNAGFSVSLVPPSSEAELDAWVAQCAGFAAAFFRVPNFSKTLFPVSGFLSYLIGEYFAGTTAAAPNDPYVVGRFIDACPTEWSDMAKAAMRTAFADEVGSEDELKALLGALLEGLVDQVEAIAVEATQDPA